MKPVKSYKLNKTITYKKFWFYLLALVLAFVAAGSLYWYKKSQTPVEVVSVQPLVVQETEPEIVSVKGRYLFSGTIVLARAVERYALVAGKYNYAQPFSKLDSFTPSQYDGWLADLECPVTNNTVSYQEQIDNLIFNCRPEWLPELSKYIKFINLANNHTNDMGTDGFVETQKHLNKAGFQIVGNYRPSDVKDNCEIMSLPVRAQLSDGQEQAMNLPVAFCAFHYFSFTPSEGELEQVKELSKIMPVFSFMHAGAEYVPSAGANQVEIAHKLIDYGSEFVVGNSPHWVQNAEVYDGKLIVYSTGNFMFDQLDEETNRGVSLDVEFEVAYDTNLAAWLELGPTCAVRHDDCFAQAKALSLNPFKLEYNFSPVANISGAGMITAKGSPAEQKSVETRLGWPQILSELAASQ